MYTSSCSPDVSGVQLGDVLVLGSLMSVTHISAGVSWPRLSPEPVQCEHVRVGGCPSAEQRHLLCVKPQPGEGTLWGQWPCQQGAEMADVLSSSALQTAKGWLDIHSCAETPTGRKELMAWKPVLYLM